jgi:hypothetical protein
MLEPTFYEEGGFQLKIVMFRPINFSTNFKKASAALRAAAVDLMRNRPL